GIRLACTRRQGGTPGNVAHIQLRHRFHADPACQRGRRGPHGAGRPRSGLLADRRGHDGTGQRPRPDPLMPVATEHSVLPVAVLVSGRGSNLAALITAQEAGTLPVRFTLVASDKADAPALRMAESHGIATLALDP